MTCPVNCTESELSTYLRALEEGYLATSCSDTNPSPRSRSISIASKSWQRGKETGAFPGFPSLRMSPNLTGDLGAGSLTSLRAASRARTSPAPERAPEWKALVLDSGGRWHESLARYDRASSSWKTRQCSLLAGSESFSETWPSWGLMLDGVSWALTMPALPTVESGSGSLLATPTATANQMCPSMQKWPGCRAMWPTPISTDWKSGCGKTGNRDPKKAAKAGLKLNEAAGGSLNPCFVEWLMGWPREWTRIDDVCPDPAPATEWGAEWEGVPRVAQDVACRADRLRALGNGQVPACVALAWRTLR